MKIKAILTIIISLLVGFSLGYITSGQVMKQEMRKRHRHSYHEMFVYKTLGIIKPSETQKDTVLPIIEEYAEKSLVLKNRVSTEFDSLMRQMSQELKPFVSEEQFRKLEENSKRVRGRYGR